MICMLLRLSMGQRVWKKSLKFSAPSPLITIQLVLQRKKYGRQQPKKESAKPLTRALSLHSLAQHQWVNSTKKSARMSPMHRHLRRYWKRRAMLSWLTWNVIPNRSVSAVSKFLTGCRNRMKLNRTTRRLMLTSTLIRWSINSWERSKSAIRGPRMNDYFRPLIKLLLLNY